MGNVCANSRKYPSKGSPRSNKSATKSFLSTHKPRLEDISRRSRASVPIEESAKTRVVRVSLSCSGKGDLLSPLRTEGILLPMATAVVGCLGTGEWFLCRAKEWPEWIYFHLWSRNRNKFSWSIRIRECSRHGVIGGGKKLEQVFRQMPKPRRLLGLRYVSVASDDSASEAMGSQHQCYTISTESQFKVESLRASLWFSTGVVWIGMPVGGLLVDIPEFGGEISTEWKSWAIGRW